MPLRIGKAEDFASVRHCLSEARFDERGVLAALKIPDLARIREADSVHMDRDTVAPARFALIALLVCGDTVGADDLRRLCGPDVFDAFASLDLIRDAGRGDGTVICPVWLYPVDGFFVASDRRTNPDIRGGAASTEVVFPAHDSGTTQFLRLLPEAHGDALDLCGGTGIGALHLARAGARAATADITPRSSHFAAFNAKLNGYDVESLCGDLYDPVADRRFDLICAHPPWVPSIGDAMVFRDGGDTGEAIVARVVAGIPYYLRPHGTAIVVSLGRDGRDGGFEQRVRGWLGDAGRDCDVILGVDKIITIDELVGSMSRLHLGNDPEKAARIAARFRELGTEKFFYGAVFLRRTGEPVSEPPLRLRMSAGARAVDFDRIFAWRRFRRSADFADWLAAARPCLSAGLDSNVRHVVRDGVLSPISAVLTTKRPLSVTIQPDLWLVQLITQLEGTQTVAQVFDSAHQAKQMPDDFSMAAFTDFVAGMIERGVLDIGVPGSGT